MKGIFQKFDKIAISGAPGEDSEAAKASKPHQEFKFNFDLPGGETAAHKQKRKKKKKKKKSAKDKVGAEGAADAEDNDNDDDEDSEPEDEEKRTSATEATVSHQPTVPVAKPPSPAVVDSAASARLEAPQTAAAQGAVTAPSSAKTAKQAKKDKAKSPAQPPSSSSLAKETAQSEPAFKGPSPKKGAKGKAAVKKEEESDDWGSVLEDAIAQAAQEKKQLKAKRKEDIMKGVVPASKTPQKRVIDKSTPRFMSPNDPELDAQMRLQARFGRGKNLVAIGPPKVRDPNWLSAPPGLPAPPSSSAPPPSAPQPQAPSSSSANVSLHSSPFSFQFPFQQSK